MRKVVVVVALVGLFSISQLSCDSGESPVAGGRANVTMLVANASSSHFFSAGRVMADSIHITKALVGVSEIDFKKLEGEEDDDDEDRDSTDMHHNDSTEMHHSGEGHGDEDDDHDGGDRISDGGDDDDDDEEGDEIKFEGSYTFDLLAETVSPTFQVPPGTYKEVKLKTAPILANGKSVIIAFDIVQDTSATHVEFSTNAKFKLELKSDEGFVVSGDSITEILVQLNLNLPLGNVDFSHATVDSDGVIRINEHTNVTLFDMISCRIKNSFKMGKDDDHDGEIDD